MPCFLPQDLRPDGVTRWVKVELNRRGSGCGVGGPGDTKDGSQRRRGKSSPWLPPQFPKPGGNVEVNCCCFSGSKLGGERGVAASAAEIRMRFLVLKGCARISLVTGRG